VADLHWWQPWGPGRSGCWIFNGLCAFCNWLTSPLFAALFPLPTSTNLPSSISRHLCRSDHAAQRARQYYLLVRSIRLRALNSRVTHNIFVVSDFLRYPPHFLQTTIYPTSFTYQRPHDFYLPPKVLLVAGHVFIARFLISDNIRHVWISRVRWPVDRLLLALHPLMVPPCYRCRISLISRSDIRYVLSCFPRSWCSR